MEESFLHHVWLYGKFNHNSLSVSDGRSLIIHKRGLHNHDSGPDFFNGRISLSNTTWVGNIEIHVKSSDWHRHNHNEDPAYQNTILHVVYEHDMEIKLPSGLILPCLELKGRIPENMENNYNALKGSILSVPCAFLNPAQAGSSILTAMNRALAERLIEKSQSISELAKKLNNDWESVFFITIAKYFGNRVNDTSMEMLARSTPIQLLHRIKDDPIKIEALLFGQAGLLNPKSKEEYPRKLWKEYEFIKNKYQLTPMPLGSWKFMRMRPAGFPTVRIAQLASLIYNETHLFSRVLQVTEILEWRQIFESKTSDYWDNHYRFESESVIKPKSIGDKALDGLLINAVSPVLFAYGCYQDSDSLKERAFDLLVKLEPEDNKITREWQSIGFQNKSAYDSQAFIGMRKLYCDQRRCVECAIGQKLIRT